MPRLPEARVDGGEDQVERLQDFVGEVERAVSEDVALAARQDADPVAGLERADLRQLCPELVDAETVGDGR